MAAVGICKMKPVPEEAVRQGGKVLQARQDAVVRMGSGVAVGW
jgi:hypothetical protein